MSTTAPPSRRQANVRCTIAAVTAAAWLAAAGFAMVECSAASIFVLLAACILTARVLVACGLPVALLVLRVHRDSDPPYQPLWPSRRRALAKLRRDLAELPEAPHPIGL